MNKENFKNTENIENKEIAGNIENKIIDYEKLVLDLIKTIEPSNKKYLECAYKKWDSVAKPLKSMGKFEDIVAKLCAINENTNISLKKRVAAVFCADNGVVVEGVTQSPMEVTGIVAKAMASGDGNINNLANTYNIDVDVIDIGMVSDIEHENIRNFKVDYATNNIRNGRAMSLEAAYKAIYYGIMLAREYKEASYDIVITGEMGIGNTTTSSALASVLLDVPVSVVTGRGAGLDSDSLKKKIEVIEDAIRINEANRNDIFELISKIGGFDIAGMTGLFLGGAIYHIPVVIDGIISEVSAALAVSILEETKDYMVASHVSSEPAGEMLLKYIGLEPIIYAGMHLGEGTGAAMLLPLLDGAINMFNSAHLFTKLNISQYEEKN